MLFSATMGAEVAEFAREALRNPVRVEVVRSGTTAERAVQHVFLATQEEKLPLLLALLEADDLSTLVFTRTKRRADKVWKVVANAGHKAAPIHADRSQGQRRMALDGFKDGTYRVLVATDIAARGIDVAEIGHVAASPTTFCRDFNGLGGEYTFAPEDAAALLGPLTLSYDFQTEWYTSSPPARANPTDFSRIVAI